MLGNYDSNFQAKSQAESYTIIIITINIKVFVAGPTASRNRLAIQRQ